MIGIISFKMAVTISEKLHQVDALTDPLRSNINIYYTISLWTVTDLQPPLLHVIFVGT